MVNDTTGVVLQLWGKQQLALLSDLQSRHDHQLLITGPAGSGKTSILLRKVQELDAETGSKEKILVLCYNKPLKERLARELEKCPSVTVRTLTSILYKLNRTRNIDKILEDRQKIHRELTFDHIFVDEGQDFTGNWRKVLTEMQAKSVCERKFYWIFFDNEQLVHTATTRFSKEVLDNEHKLNEVYRMTGTIFEQFKKYLSDPEECSIAHDIHGRFIEWDEMDQETDPADPKVACEHIAKQVNLLQKKKVSAMDICVLVRDKKKVADPVMEGLISMGIKCQNAEDSIANPDNSAIIVDSIRRFKGLETKVLVLYNPADPKDRKVRELMNTALSRSLCLVIIIAPKQAVLSLQSDVGTTYQPGHFRRLLAALNSCSRFST